MVIDYLKGDESVRNAFDKAKIDLSKVSIASVTLYELLHYPNRKREAAILDFISRITVLPFDTETSIEAAIMIRDLEFRGRSIDAPDLFIVATALHNNEILVTSDRDFESLNRKEILIIGK